MVKQIYCSKEKWEVVGSAYARVMDSAMTIPVKSPVSAGKVLYFTPLSIETTDFSKLGNVQ